LFGLGNELFENEVIVDESEKLFEVELAALHEVGQFLDACNVCAASAHTDGMHFVFDVLLLDSVLLAFLAERVLQVAHPLQTVDVVERCSVCFFNVSYFVYDCSLFEFLGGRQCQASFSQIS